MCFLLSLCFMYIEIAVEGAVCFIHDPSTNPQSLVTQNYSHVDQHLIDVIRDN